MRNRKDVALFVQKQLHYTYDCQREKSGRHHYGLQELRELLDFIYESTPKTLEENIPDDPWR
jgi:hypothetical protein